MASYHLVLDLPRFSSIAERRAIERLTIRRCILLESRYTTPRALPGLRFLCHQIQADYIQLVRPGRSLA